MNRELPSWQRLAEAARQAPAPPSDGPSQIPWLSELEPQVRAAFLRLLWRSAAVWAALIAAAVLAFAIWNSRSAAAADDPVPATPTLPVPPLP
jgi:hypothetical protein